MKSICSTNILALDTSINSMGYCWLKCHGEDIEINSMGLAESEKESEEDRIIEMLNWLNDILKYRDISNLIVVLEKPPATMYNEQSSKNQVIARATSLFKLFMLYGALYQFLFDRGIKTISILPIEWQRKVKRRGLDIKMLSIGLANQRLAKDNEKSNRLGGHSIWTGMMPNNHNVADAVNIAFNVWQYRDKLLRNIFPELVSEASDD